MCFVHKFEQGLQTGGVLSELRNHPHHGYKLFKGADADLTASLIESIVEFEYNGLDKGSNLLTAAQGIEFGWIQLLQAAESKEAVFTFDDGNSYEISLSKILQWMTGGSRMPAIGLPSNVTVKFDSGILLPKMNTCALQVAIPLRLEFQDPDKFVKQMAEWIINSEGYGLV